MLFKGAVLVMFSFSFHGPTGVEGHGHLVSPRSRNFYAHDIISTGECQGQVGCPPGEYCQHCLNGNTGVCGKSTVHDYETFTGWLDKTGQPMPWRSQGVLDANGDVLPYEEGGLMVVDSYLDTHHNGHHEIRACAMDDNDPTMCSKPEHFEGKELHFVRDLVYPGESHPAMPPDPAYPHRGMYAGGQGGGTKWFRHEFRLPAGVSGEKVLLQWKYITANSCSPPGYSTYFSNNPDLPSSYWTQGVSDCTPPYPADGSRSTTWPEQFFNCAEISVVGSSGTFAPTISPKPTPNPTTGQPTTSAAPTAVGGPPPCLAEWEDCTYNWQGCCDGFKCKQVDEWGYGRCLQDTCGNGPTPPTPTPPTNPPPPTWPTNPPPSPTNPPVNPPSPTPPTGPADACCTINLKTCHHPEGNFCRLNQENCEGPCGKLWLPDGPLDGCIALWESGCSTDSDCCQHGECRGGSCESDDPWLKDSTRAPVTAQPTNTPTTPIPTKTPTNNPTNAPTTSAPTCNVCDDRESKWMIDNGIDCAIDNETRLNNKCNKDANWTTKGWCRLSCYNAGNGYPGDVCCGPATQEPTLSPTRKPTAKPTAPPVPPAPTPEPTSGGTVCCAERNEGYQSCSTNAWCNESDSNCSNCGGMVTTVPLQRTGCCTWGGGDCSGIDPMTNAACQFLQADCTGMCGGSWMPF